MKRTFQVFSKEDDLESTADSQQLICSVYSLLHSTTNSQQLFTKRLNSNKAIPTMSRQPSRSSSSNISLGPLSSRSASHSLPSPLDPLLSEVTCNSFQLKEALMIFSDNFTKKQLRLIMADLRSIKDKADSFIASNKESRYLKCLEIIAFAQRFCDGRCNGRPLSDYAHLQRGLSSPIVISDSILDQLYDALRPSSKALSHTQYDVALAGLSSSKHLVEEFINMSISEQYIRCLEYVALEQTLCDGCCNGKSN